MSTDEDKLHMQVYSSRVQSAFSKIFVTREYPMLIHGVRICGSLLTGYDFLASWEKRTVFYSFYKLEIFLAKLFSSQKSANIL